jgi:phosphate transport system substrate-binding protein
MKKINLSLATLLILGFCALLSCKFYAEESTTYGKNKIGIDITLQPPMAEELRLFHLTYKDAELTPIYKPELDLINEIKNDSLRLFVLGRKLTPEECDFGNGRSFVPRYTTVGIDALAIIENPSNPTKLFTYEEIEKIFKGEITQWSQLDKNNNLKNIQLFFDGNNSSTATYFMDKFGVKKLPKGAAGAEGNLDVIEKISKVPNAIGFIGMSWLSNMTDKELSDVNGKVKLAFIRPKGSTLDQYYQADPMNVSDSLYPFIRPIYVIDAGRTTLGTGLASFIFSDVGQRAMLKTGTLPIQMPTRKMIFDYNKKPIAK